MRKAVILLALLAVLGAVADHAARDYAEGRVAAQVQTSFELDERPRVGIGGWPFLWHAVGGEFPSITVHADAVSRGSVTLSEVEFSVRDVRVSLGALLGSDRRFVRVGSGGGEAAMSAEDLNEALARNGAPVTVTFEGSATLVSLPDGSTVSGTVGVSGTSLLVGAPGVEEFSLALPVPARGIRYKSVRVRDSKAILTFEFTRSRLEIG